MEDPKNSILSNLLFGLPFNKQLVENIKSIDLKLILGHMVQKTYDAKLILAKFFFIFLNILVFYEKLFVYASNGHIVIDKVVKHLHHY